jgi:sugar lactone lactonase YvrE
MQFISSYARRRGTRGEEESAMKSLYFGGAMLTAFSVIFAIAAPVAASASAQAAPATLPVVTTFAPGDFPESLAVDGQGNLYASLGFRGDVVKVAPSGQQQTLAHLDVGGGLLTGLAFDPGGALYVADATFQAAPTAPGVFRIGPGGGVTRVATLPGESFPNGLAFHDGGLYITDSARGAIWRLAPGGKPAIWLQHPLLAPAQKTGIGANGLAFWQGSLYIAVADSGSIIRVPMRTGGGAGTPEVAAQANVLRTADGIAFDAHGNLYVTVNNNRLVRLAPDGALTELAAKNDGLVYPTMPAFGTTPATRTTLYITNGALGNGTPDIVAFNAGTRGLPLP